MAFNADVNTVSVISGRPEHIAIFFLISFYNSKLLADFLYIIVEIMSSGDMNEGN